MPSLSLRDGTYLAAKCNTCGALVARLSLISEWILVAPGEVRPCGIHLTPADILARYSVMA